VSASTPAVDVVAGVARVQDTCNVYVLRSGRDALVIDWGTGTVVDRLDELGIDRITDVLVTHHHRDQVQGLQRAVDAGARVWVPPVEQDLFGRVDEHWLMRQVDNDYDVRQDRFSLLEPVVVAGVVHEYRTTRYGDFDVYALPTPGHTHGSLTYIVETEGKRLAFCGDLLYGDGKVWSVAATQWSYSGVEGLAASHISCSLLGERAPDVLLPSHGEPITGPAHALALTRTRVQELVDLRLEQPWHLDNWLRNPWVVLSPHLLWNRSAFAHSYALLSDSGAALIIDWGFDLTVGATVSTRREARRPLLVSTEVLRRDFGVERIEAVVATHYHDDHVAGMNLLRDVEGTEVWAPENVAPIMAEPARYDLPCLWFDPVPADRTLTFREPVTWHEYELTAYPLPGHTLYAAAIGFEVDGKRVLATGDQQGGGGSGGTDILNYQYLNRFRIDDFVASAELYRELRPELLITGHWEPREVTDEYLERLLADGRRLAELHRELLPLDEVDFGAEGFGARIEPYRSRVAAGGAFDLDVTVRNPFARAATASVALALPPGWAEVAAQDAEVAPLGETTLRFRVAAGAPARRARVGADLTVDGVPFGQQAEALVDVT
jgi:glyoxylase-like metal-dependent hydrolase (beta-lactamase superfamily II)